MGSFAQRNLFIGLTVLSILVVSALASILSIPLVATKWWTQGLSTREVWMTIPALIFFGLVALYLFFTRGIFLSRGV